MTNATDQYRLRKHGHSHTLSEQTQRAIVLAERLAPIMYGLSLVFLILLAILIVNSLAAQMFSGALYDPGGWARASLFLLWPLFILEFLLSAWHNRHRSYRKLLLPALACLIPPLRLSTPSAAKEGAIWLPKRGWQQPGRALSIQLEHSFSKPMLLIALLILPVLLLEFGFRGTIEKYPWLNLIIHLSTGLIWCAFTYEFIVMVNATNKKIAYVKKNWIDLAIILLPLISFLRSVRVLRIARLARLQKLAKISRVYRMRGLGMKVFRAMLVLQFANRILGVTPQKRLAKLQREYAEKKEELAELETDIKALKDKIAQSEGN